MFPQNAFLVNPHERSTIQADKRLLEQSGNGREAQRGTKSYLLNITAYLAIFSVWPNLTVFPASRFHSFRLSNGTL